MSIVPMPGTEGLAHHELGQQGQPEAAQVSATDAVSHPAHYTSGGIETIDAIEAWDLGFHLGNVVKYVSRAGKKDPARTVEDLRKAKWYLERAIERADDEPRGIVVSAMQPLTADEVEQLRRRVRAAFTGTASPVVTRARAQTNAKVMKALLQFGRALRIARERHERETRAALQRACRVGSAEDPSCFTFRAACTVDPSGYSEGNRAEALHSIEGDA